MGNSENIITKTQDFLKYIIPQLEKFPRNQKFLLADRIENHLLNLLELFIKAFYSSKNEKPVMLREANLKLEIMRHLIRICYEMKYINAHKYEVISKTINEIGAMNGGWLKSITGDASM